MLKEDKIKHLINLARMISPERSVDSAVYSEEILTSSASRSLSLSLWFEILEAIVDVEEDRDKELKDGLHDIYHESRIDYLVFLGMAENFYEVVRRVYGRTNDFRPKKIASRGTI